MPETVWSRDKRYWDRTLTRCSHCGEFDNCFGVRQGQYICPLCLEKREWAPVRTYEEDIELRKKRIHMGDAEDHLQEYVCQPVRRKLFIAPSHK